ncbi:MAG TPA: ABC transporter ATP-binding protein [Anaerolineae bacterium]|nr:ABC transporter ATP-binding protein [Anaerolineae bacterium]
MRRGGEIAVRMVGITKRFPGTLACNNITFEVRAGEVHGLLGENGAGKTTLMNILYGLHQPDSGEIYVNGREARIASARAAVDLGIGMVHQHFMLVDNLSVLENVILGLPLKRPPLLDLDSAHARFKELTTEYGLDLDPSTPVWQLAVGDQQWLEILKLLFRDARILILDEPTSVLAPSQAERLFESMRRLADEGRSTVFISHKLREMKEVADRVTVLRDGHVVGTVDPGETSPTELARMMVGRDVFLDRRPRAPSESKRAVLEINGLSCQDDRGVPALRDLSLTVHAGEIVGVAGVAGNGQLELAECIAGLRRPTEGTVRINEELITGVTRDPSLLGYIPEDRRKTGLVLDLTLEENLIIKTFDSPPLARRGILQWNSIGNRANALIQDYDIKTPHRTIPLRHLSGGHQQRVVVARELHGKPALLVASQPTRGLDVASVEAVHNMLLHERNRGAAVLFISAELSEVLAVSDRIVVFFRGEIMGELNAETPDINLIGEMMLGHRERAQAAVGGST